MKILAVDTSTSIAGISIIEDGVVLLELNINNINKTHSKKLVPLVSSMLKELNFEICDFDAFAVATGPGSFTGLRIGITTVKTFAYIVKKPIIGVKTLDMLAYNFPVVNCIVCPIINARNKQVYTSLYVNENVLQTRIEDYMAIHIEELVRILLEKNKSIVFLGDGIVEHEQFLNEKLGEKCIIAPGNLNMQKASTLAIVANQMFLNGEIDDCYELEPFYMRKSQAERMKQMKKAEENYET